MKHIIKLAIFKNIDVLSRLFVSKKVYLLTSIIVLSFLFTLKSNAQTVDESNAKELMSTYYNEDFNPFNKKNFYATFSMSLKSKDITYEEKLLETVLSGKTENYDISLGAGYFFSDYFSFKADFNFGQEKENSTVLKLFDSINVNSLNTNYSISPALRASIPIVPNKRLNLFFEVGVDFGWGNTVERDFYQDGTITKSFSDNYSFGVGADAGVTLFVLQIFSLELGLNVVGYNYDRDIIKENDLPESRIDSHEVDFKLNLLSINMALTYYIGAKK